VSQLLKRLIRRMANRCGLEIMSRRRVHDYESGLHQAHVERDRTRNELARTRFEYEARLTNYESRLANKVLELAKAQGAYQDARAQLQQTQKALQAEVGPAAAAEEEGARARTDAEALVANGREAQRRGDEGEAVRQFRAALDLIHRYGPARQELAELAAAYWQRGTALRDEGDAVGAKRHLVRAVEFDPTHGQARADLEALLRAEGRRDLTRQCFVYHDPTRGERVYREAFLRALEYVAVAGITGEVLEFGVLGGFTARLIAETMRDLLIVKQLHLFDSFEGLPEYTSPVDAHSYDVEGRKLWADRMRFSDAFVAELGDPIDQHIFSRLCDVLSPERLFVYRGYFAQTLHKPPAVKAALLHVDCDLYQSTQEVLTRLYEADVLQDGSVVLFDDYNCFKASPYFGERRAFREFLEGQTKFEATPFFTYGFNGAAFFLHERQA
jgi:tetratricopeptide (TPR) repeat protein